MYSFEDLDPSELEKIGKIEKTIGEIFDECGNFTPEQLTNLPYDYPDVLTSTTAVDVKRRYDVLERFGYEFKYPLEMTRQIVKKLGDWEEVAAPAAPFRSEVITAYFIFRLINEIVVVQTGLTEVWSLEEVSTGQEEAQNKKTKKIPKREIGSWPLFDPDAPEPEKRRMNCIKQCIERILEYRMSNTSVINQVDGYHEGITWESISRAGSGKANSDGLVSLDDLEYITINVLKALKKYMEKH